MQNVEEKYISAPYKTRRQNGASICGQSICRKSNKTKGVPGKSSDFMGNLGRGYKIEKV